MDSNLLEYNTHNYLMQGITLLCNHVQESRVVDTIQNQRKEKINMSQLQQLILMMLYTLGIQDKEIQELKEKLLDKQERKF